MVSAMSSLKYFDLTFMRHRPVALLATTLCRRCLVVFFSARLCHPCQHTHGIGSARRQHAVGAPSAPARPADARAAPRGRYAVGLARPAHRGTHARLAHGHTAAPMLPAHSAAAPAPCSIMADLRLAALLEAAAHVSVRAEEHDGANARLGLQALGRVVRLANQHQHNAHHNARQHAAFGNGTPVHLRRGGGQARPASPAPPRALGDTQWRGRVTGVGVGV